MPKTQNTFQRREKKIIMDSSLLPDILQTVSEFMNPDSYNLNGIPYDICNIYFDNGNRDVTRHSVSKPFFKEKLRLRCYGIPTEDSKVFFELKKKTAKIGTKRRAVLSLNDYYRFLSEGYVDPSSQYINKRVLAEIANFIDTYSAEPSVYLSYKRIAFFGKEDPNLRLTFDTEIRTRNYDLRPELGIYGELLLPKDKTIAEIKFSGAAPMWFAALMSKHGLEFSPYSKIGKEYELKILNKNNSEETIKI